MYFPSPSVRITNALSGIGVGVEAFGKGFPVESVVPMVPISLLPLQNCIPFFVSSMIFFLLFQICNSPLTSFNVSPVLLKEFSKTSAWIIPALIKLALNMLSNVHAELKGPFQPFLEKAMPFLFIRRTSLALFKSGLSMIKILDGFSFGHKTT